MVKGHMEKDGFHPHTQSKGVSKSRDQKVKTKGVRMKRNDSKTDYYKSLNRKELESALVLKQKIIAGMDDALESKYQDKHSEHFREGLRLQKQNKKDLELIKKLLKKPRKARGVNHNPFLDPFDRDASNMHLRDKGHTYFHGGKAYQVDYDQGLGIISVDERYQDKDNKWHTGKNIFFAQGEDGQDIARDAGGYHVDTIMNYLDSAGVLE